MDVVANLITKIRNAAMAGHEKVDVPASRLRISIVEVLKSTGYVKNFKVVKDGKQGLMRVYLKYNDKGKSAIDNISRMSRPGRRYYVNAENIPHVQSGYGIAILSTNRGIMSNHEAKKQHLGGEYLVKVW